MPGSKPGALSHLATPLQLDRQEPCCLVPASPSGIHAAASAPPRRHPGPKPLRQASPAPLRGFARSANSTKQPLPEPVRRGGRSATAPRTRPRRPVRARAVPARTHSRRQHPKRSRDIVAGAASRVNSGAWNNAAVGACTPGSTSTYQAGGRSIGVRRSPTPSAQALSPRTKTGTSAPSCRPSSASRSAPRSVPQSRSARAARSPHRRCRRRSRRRPECAFRRRCRHLRAVRLRIAAAGRAHGEVVVLGHARNRRRPMADDPAVVAHPQPDRVAPVEQPEHGLQQVVAVGRRPMMRRNRLSLAGAGQADQPSPSMPGIAHGAARASAQ